MSLEFEMTPVEKIPLTRRKASGLYQKILDTFIESPHESVIVSMEDRHATDLSNHLRRRIKKHYEGVLDVYVYSNECYLEKLESYIPPPKQLFGVVSDDLFFKITFIYDYLISQEKDPKEDKDPKDLKFKELIGEIIELGVPIFAEKYLPDTGFAVMSRPISH